MIAIAALLEAVADSLEEEPRPVDAEPKVFRDFYKKFQSQEDLDKHVLTLDKVHQKHYAKHNGALEIYRNLHSVALPDEGIRRMDLWSIKLPGPRGLVLGHAKRVVIQNASFDVDQKLRDQVARTGKKTVHAVVRGNVMFNPPESVKGDVKFMYIPNRMPWFMDENKKFLYGADLVEFRDPQSMPEWKIECWAKNPRYEDPLLDEHSKELERIKNEPYPQFPRPKRSTMRQLTPEEIELLKGPA